MRADELIEEIRNLDISVITGIPDSALKPFCDYCNSTRLSGFSHYVPANEGAAVGIAMGTYLSTGRPACVYMQNSGLGNGVNPITSLANAKVYGIPMLFLIGWRGEPGKKDEPQHQFMGAVTEQMLHVLNIEYSIFSAETGTEERKQAFLKAGEALQSERQYAFLIKKGTFGDGPLGRYENPFCLIREKVIGEVLESLGEPDIVVSTTGKISREVYERADALWGNHERCFLTVGGMGHASMIAFGIALNCPERKVYCIEGDGAMLMHLGSTAYIGAQKPDNLVHICLNNHAHESVGGMPTGVGELDFYKLAQTSGYGFVRLIQTEEELRKGLQEAREAKGTAFLEIRVSMAAREDLGRPKEKAAENKMSFMKAVSGVI